MYARLNVFCALQKWLLLDQVLQLFGIQPDYDLNLMQPDQSPSDVLAQVLTNMQAPLRDAQTLLLTTRQRKRRLLQTIFDFFP